MTQKTGAKFIRNRDSAAFVSRTWSCESEYIYIYIYIPSPEQQAKFAEMQRADPKLETAFMKAETRTSGFVLQNGILFKEKPKHIRSTNEFLLVLPDVCKAKILKQVHDSVNTGFHTGYKRTMMRIWRVFYVPKSEIKSTLRHAKFVNVLHRNSSTREQSYLFRKPIRNSEEHSW